MPNLFPFSWNQRSDLKKTTTAHPELPFKKNYRYLKVFMLVMSFLLLNSLVCLRGVWADSPKGQWGYVTPIADNNHPNLYYNQSEVDELRQMILVDQRPESLVSLYNNVIRYAIAQPPTYDEYDSNNMKAAMNYMIEPNEAKAWAIRTSLLGYREAFPEGLLSWYTTGGCHACGYFLPWMFDLLQAYHPEILSAEEVADLKYWFKLSAQILKVDSRDSFAVSSPADTRENWIVPTTIREGKRMSRWPNWYGRYMGPALAAALVSGDQAAVDFWADSGWPHDLLTYDGVTSDYPSDDANRFDLVMYLLAVYPSGANSDSYEREGLNLEAGTWRTTTYAPGSDGGAYHFAQMSGAMMAAEMAYHNGMTKVFEITDQGNEPALLRTFKRAIASRYERDVRADSKTGHPFLWHDPIHFLGYRRYADPTLESIIPLIYVDEPCGMQCGPDPLPESKLFEFFAYPRRIVWTSDGGVPTQTSPNGTEVPPADQIIDYNKDSWTFDGGASGYILRNGEYTGGWGIGLLWLSGKIYALAGEESWWVWSGSSWTYYGNTKPGGDGEQPKTSSPEGTVIPPANEIIDNEGGVWTLDGSDGGYILRNGSVAANGWGYSLIWSGGSIHALGDDYQWWRWNGSNWEQ